MLFNNFLEISFLQFTCVFRSGLGLKSGGRLKIFRNFLIFEFDQVFIIFTSVPLLMLMVKPRRFLNYFHKVTLECVNLIFVFAKDRCRDCFCTRVEAEPSHDSVDEIGVTLLLGFVLYDHVLLVLNFNGGGWFYLVHYLQLALLHFIARIIKLNF
jgi:hypothetical protein